MLIRRTGARWLYRRKGFGEGEGGFGRQGGYEIRDEMKSARATKQTVQNTVYEQTRKPSDAENRIELFHELNKIKKILHWNQSRSCG